MPISRKQLLEHLLPALNNLFGDEYAKLNYTEYHVKVRYGKCTIYRWDFNGGVRTSTTLAKNLDKETAAGMMKLLKEPDENINS